MFEDQPPATAGGSDKNMATETDQARLIAERVARRVAGTPSAPAQRANNPAPPRAELAEIRSVLTDLQRKLDRVESKMTGPEPPQSEEAPRARFHDFVNSARPADSFPAGPSPAPRQERAQPRAQSAAQEPADKFSEFTPPTHSPWLSGVYIPATHASQERFGVEEATVSELVEFFENEKKCSMEPGEKPCDHCDMCSSRGF
jgi:hypothetical protein